MKTAFKASFLKAIKKIDSDQLRADIADAILNVETAETLDKSVSSRSLRAINNITA